MLDKYPLKKILLENKISLGAFTSAMIISLISFISKDISNHSNLNSTMNTTNFIDTYIPVGFAIVPIDISNHNSLDSLIGDRGVVDLYTQNLTQIKQPSKKIASRVKIVRAPLNPNQFAIIVPDKKVSTILSYEGPYYVTIHNSQLREPLNIKQKTIRQKRLFIDHIIE